MKICSLLFCLIFTVSYMYAQQNGKVPDAVNKWIKNELSKEKKNGCPSFFCNENSRLIGYIKGYDPKYGFATGIIYASNEVTNETYPLVAEIQPDGRFEATIPMTYPRITSVIFKEERFRFYIEPGKTLAMILDGNDLLKADSDGDAEYKMNIEFQGSLAGLNNELRQYTVQIDDYQAWSKKIKTVAPVDFAQEQLRKQEEELRRFDKIAQEKKLSPKAVAILRNTLYVSYATMLLDFALYRGFATEADTSNVLLKTPVPDNYYSFLKAIPTINDPGFLISPEFGTFVNRLEFCDPFRSFSTGVSGNSKVEQLLQGWSIKDAAYTQRLGLSSGLLYDIIKIRSLASAFNFTLSDNKQDAKEYVSALSKGFHDPFLKQEAYRLMEEKYPETKMAYTLSAGKATDIFKKIIDPFKGKVLFIDFWATTCGPCVGGIKSMKNNRDKYVGNPNFDFLFITDESASPLDDYSKFVQEQKLVNTFRVTTDEFNYLRQLFRFNGIPRYVVIDKDGKVYDDNFRMYAFGSELKRIFPEME